MESLDNFVAERILEEALRKPVPGQKWIRREDKPACLFRRGLKLVGIPKMVEVKEYRPSWSGHEVLVTDEDGAAWRFRDFHLFYELHRPTIWERVNKEGP